VEKLQQRAFADGIRLGDKTLDGFSECFISFLECSFDLAQFLECTAMKIVSAVRHEFQEIKPQEKGKQREDNKNPGQLAKQKADISGSFHGFPIQVDRLTIRAVE
jgi:hypothetical protein